MILAFHRSVSRQISIAGALFFLLAAAAFASTPIEPDPTKAALIRIAAAAGFGDPYAMESLRNQHRTCLAWDRDLDLSTERETQICIPLRRILTLLDPKILRASPIIQKTARLSSDTFALFAIKYMGLIPGRTYVYRGQKKKLGDDRWRDASERLVRHVLKMQNTLLGTECFILEGLYDKDVLIRQTMIEFLLSKDGVEMSRDVAYNRPQDHDDEATGPAPVGPQDSILLFTPATLKEGATLDGYQAYISTEMTAAGAARSTDTLIVSNLIEKYVFALDEGMASVEYYDSKWILTKRDLHVYDENRGLNDRETKTLEAAIFKYCKKEGIEDPRILSLRKAVTAKRIRPRLQAFEKGANPEEIFPRLRPRRRIIQSILSGFRKDSADDVQRRYSRIDLSWIISDIPEEPGWIPLTAPLETDFQ